MFTSTLKGLSSEYSVTTWVTIKSMTICEQQVIAFDHITDVSTMVIRRTKPCPANVEI